MPAQLSFLANRKKFLVYAITAVGLGIFIASSATAATTWTITINVKNGSNKPKYSFDYDVYPNCTGLPAPAAQDAGKLIVCPGDKVQWQLSTKGAKGLLAIHQNRGFQPLTTPNDTWFRGDVATMAYVVTDGHDHGTPYEYCVAVYDDQGEKIQLYSHDPQIIIGGTKLEIRLDELQKTFDPLLNTIVDDSKESKKVREQASKLRKQIEDLKRLIEK